MWPLCRMGIVLALLFVSACGSITPDCPMPDVSRDTVFVTQEGWHVDLGLPVAQLTPPLAFLRDDFPGANYLLIGYGKKTFFTAPVDDIGEYIIGPVPGRAVIHAVGLTVPPSVAYPPGDTIALTLTREQQALLMDFISSDLTHENGKRPKVIAEGHNPDGLFYDANSEYNLLHTCNGWAVQALMAAGLPVDDDGVIFSGAAMREVKKAADRQCPSQASAP